MSELSFSEEDFNKNIMEIFNMSEIINDNFKINEKNGKFYLSKQQKISIKSEQNKNPEKDDEDVSAASCGLEEVLSVDYHILFHPSYQVPTLYFTAFMDDSRLLRIEEISKMFVNEYEFRNCHDEILNIISQSEHPILQKPFFMIHPCKINQVLSQFPQSRNYVLTFLSLFGPSVHLKLNSDYEKFYTDDLNKKCI